MKPIGQKEEFPSLKMENLMQSIFSLSNQLEHVSAHQLF